MASQKKIRRLKSKYLHKGALKNKTMKCKRGLFYTPSQRQYLKTSICLED